MTTTFQQVTDSGRATAAFKLGIYSQRICLGSLSESLVQLRRDIPGRVLEILLGLVRTLDHVHFSSERATQDFGSWKYQDHDHRLSFQREIEVRERELRDLADLAIPSNSELRPLFELGRLLGSLWQYLCGSNPQQQNETTAPKVLQRVLSQAMDLSKNAADLEVPGEIALIVQSMYALVRDHREVERLCREALLLVDRRSPNSTAEIVDELVRHLRALASTVLFERVAEDDTHNARDAWLYEQAKHGANCEELAKALREKRADPKAAKWKYVGAQGIRDAISRYATRQDLPAITFLRGRPAKKINRR